MDKRLIKVLKWFVGICLIFLLLRFLAPTRLLSYFGQIEIVDKEASNGEYYITTDLGEGLIVIEMNENEYFPFEESPGVSRDVSITEVWNMIEVGESYFALVEYTGFFNPQYKIEKLHGY